MSNMALQGLVLTGFTNIALKLVGKVLQKAIVLIYTDGDVGEVKGTAFTFMMR